MKRGVMYTASLVLYLSTLLTFAVMLYKNTEDSEMKIIPLTYAARAHALDDSIGMSFRDIYNSTMNTTFSTETVNISGTMYDIITINTTMSPPGGSSNISSLISGMEYLILSQEAGVTFDSSLLASSLNISIGNFLGFYKNESCATGGDWILIYYNQSGKANVTVYQLNISIMTPSTAASLNWTGTSPLAPCPNCGGNVNITYYDTDSASPDAIALYRDFSLPTGGIGKVYNLSLNDTSTYFVNITLDSEKIAIQGLSGYDNLTIKLVTPSLSRELSLKIPVNAFNITDIHYGLRKISNIEFI